ncbi:hypothetical protein COS86_00665 [Candidatus Bathyarchaeota archaeon CG07_land_8_20_14_0_80_47_9]|nr:MAG: hypothetical protein COS86_00665 [Candidatus Bathyarchaeota archaeon CG07_land_8_20_14_0_80_47_9]
MKAEIAVATLSGKAYYIIVNELRKRGVPFLSLTPAEPIPAEIKVVITTQEERCLVNHDRVLVYQNEVEPEALASEALQIVQGKEYFEKIVIGIDPGEVLGVAVLADGKIIETANCFSVKETTDKVKNILKNLKNVPTDYVSVKIGDGVPACKEKLLRGLDKALPPNVVLESVSEAGTNRNLNETKHRRGLRDIVSAIRIAGRNGHKFQRRKTNEPNS